MSWPPLAHATMIKKSAALVEALTGRFNKHHPFMVKLHLDRIDQIAITVTELDARVDEVTEPFVLARELLMTIPGISKNVANVLIAEAGVDMDIFPTAGHLASWAGVCPGQNEQVGVSTLTFSGKLGRLTMSRSERNDRLLSRARVLAARSLGMVPPFSATVIELVHSKAAQEMFRHSLPPGRFRRLPRVLGHALTGAYSRFGNGSRDVLRDLVQPAC